jgi:hypothetical protein
MAATATPMAIWSASSTSADRGVPDESVALGVALPAIILAVSEAEAQTAGMKRREERREDSQGRCEVSSRRACPRATSGHAAA